MKSFLIKSVSFYQKYISPLKKPSCVFYPTCSEYLKEAIKNYKQRLLGSVKTKSYTEKKRTCCGSCQKSKARKPKKK